MKSILIIEDDHYSRESIKSVLESYDYHIIDASNGQEALDMLSHCNKMPHLIILDLNMPVMNGTEFREAQLKDQRFAPIPVILLTGKNTSEETKDRLKPHQFLNKPVDLNDLIFVVNNFFLLEH